MTSKANRLLTPGAFDPLATRQIICTKGYATSRRPTIWQSLKLKAQAMKLYGIPRTPLNWHKYTLDHLIPLELGGIALSLNNAWPQLKTTAKTKDLDENRLKREVCNLLVDLRAAQQFFVDRWSK